MATQSTTREQRAQSLLTTGAVSLFVGKGYADVQGSGANVYRVSRDGCTCPDAAKRGRPCKHEIAVQSLCGEYRAWQAKAAQGERIRPSSVLLAAIRWPTKATAPAAPAQGAPAAGCRECGAPTGFDVCSGCYFGEPAEPVQAVA